MPEITVHLESRSVLDHEDRLLADIRQALSSEGARVAAVASLDGGRVSTAFKLDAETTAEALALGANMFGRALGRIGAKPGITEAIGYPRVPVAAPAESSSHRPG